LRDLAQRLQIRKWRGLVTCQPDRGFPTSTSTACLSIRPIGKLIETHWQDLMQVALSVQVGKISSPMLLRKLGSYNRLHLATQVLVGVGVVRTIFLLD
jgi:TnpA family transposase